jgi:hypothetical protein
MGEYPGENEAGIQPNWKAQNGNPGINALGEGVVPAK